MNTFSSLGPTQPVKDNDVWEYLATPVSVKYSMNSNVIPLNCKCSAHLPFTMAPWLLRFSNQGPYQLHDWTYVTTNLLYPGSPPNVYTSVCFGGEECKEHSGPCQMLRHIKTDIFPEITPLSPSRAISLALRGCVCWFGFVVPYRV